jgi:hypothetical protein
LAVAIEGLACAYENRFADDDRFARRCVVPRLARVRLGGAAVVVGGALGGGPGRSSRAVSARLPLEAVAGASSCAPAPSAVVMGASSVGTAPLRGSSPHAARHRLDTHSKRSDRGQKSGLVMAMDCTKSAMLDWRALLRELTTTSPCTQTRRAASRRAVAASSLLLRQLTGERGQRCGALLLEGVGGGGELDRERGAPEDADRWVVTRRAERGEASPGRMQRR